MAATNVWCSRCYGCLLTEPVSRHPGRLDRWARVAAEPIGFLTALGAAAGGTTIAEASGGQNGAKA
jgi:hypothetical protein